MNTSPTSREGFDAKFVFNDYAGEEGWDKIQTKTMLMPYSMVFLFVLVVKQ